MLLSPMSLNKETGTMLDKNNPISYVRKDNLTCFTCGNFKK